jgi:ATP-binding cassette subfamily C protein
MLKWILLKKVLGFAMNGVRKDAKLLVASLLGSLIGLLIPVLSGMIYDDVIPTDKSIHLEIFAIMILSGWSAGQLAQGVYK